MRRRISAVALASAALLTVVTVAANAAQAVAPSASPSSVASVDSDPPVGSDNDPETLPPPAEQIQSDARALEWGYILGAADASDLMGYLPSLYRGKWFMPGKEDTRKCIMDRESNFNYRATSGLYHGAYQMSGPLGVGATWRMQREVRREFGEDGLAIVRDLRKLTPNKWNRYWQDRAFWTIWRDGDGAGHWRHGSAC